MDAQIERDGATAMAPSRNDQNGNSKRVSERPVTCNRQVAERVALTETSLVSEKQVRRIVRAVGRKLDSKYSMAWLLGVAVGLGPMEAASAGPFGFADERNGSIYLNHSVVVLGTVIAAIAFALIPKPADRVESLSWLDRWLELRDELLSLARRVLR